MNAMKIHIIIILVCLLFWTSCSEYEMKAYELDPRINFVGKKVSGTVSNDPGDMVYEKNFGINPRGGRMTEDTLRVLVRVQGDVADADRKVVFKLNNGNNGIEILNLDGHILPAGEVQGEYALRVKRPGVIDVELTDSLTFDYEHSDFNKGKEEQQYYSLTCSDIVNMETLNVSEKTWNRRFAPKLGSWSCTKARFIIDILGKTNFGTWYSVTAKQRENLVAALEAYKADSSNPPLYDETKLPVEEWISFD